MEKRNKRNKIQQAAFKNGTRQNEQENVSTNLICIGFSYNDREYIKENEKKNNNNNKNI